MNAHEKAAAWTGAYFTNRGYIPTPQQYGIIYDMALGHFLKLANS